MMMRGHDNLSVNDQMEDLRERMRLLQGDRKVSKGSSMIQFPLVLYGNKRHEIHCCSKCLDRTLASAAVTREPLCHVGFPCRPSKISNGKTNNKGLCDFLRSLWMDLTGFYDITFRQTSTFWRRTRAPTRRRSGD